MSVKKTKIAIRALGALAQESRLAIFRLLVQRGDCGYSVGEIAAHLGMANATLSFHLKELSHAELVESKQVGRFIYYTANYPAMNQLIGFLTENCCQGEACGGEASTCMPAVAKRRKSAAGSPRQAAVKRKRAA